MEAKKHPATAGTEAGRETKQTNNAKLPSFQTFASENQQSATNNRLAVARSIVGEIFFHATGLYCICPGASRHTSATYNRDCRLYLADVPTVHCLHFSCKPAVDEANRALRSTLGKIETGCCKAVPVYQKSQAEIIREREDRESARLSLKARGCLPKILSAYPWPVEQIFSDSPEGVAGDPKHDWRLLLSLFEPEDILWIGDKKESGSPRQAHHFRTAAGWLESRECPAGPFILPATLKPGVFSRRKEDIALLPYLVIESDILDKDSIGAVFRWLRDVVELPLRAVVDTGRRSLHGWFNRPSIAVLKDLAAILPALQCDGSLLRESQPVRLPGCQRPGTDKQQVLLYFSRGGLQ